MSSTWNGKSSKWPEHVQCYADGCEEECDLVEDEGNGYTTYYCPVHEMWGCQYDDFDDDYDPEMDFGYEFDPYEGDYEDGEDDE